jgi:hypothetical protein
MFLTLLAVTLAVSALVAVVVAGAFTGPMGRILRRIIADEISSGWLRYMQFAIIVIGISGGVGIYQLERYVNPDRSGDQVVQPLVLTQDRWVLEIYRTVIGTLQSIAWMLLWFFAIALVAYVIARAFELRRARQEGSKEPGA